MRWPKLLPCGLTSQIVGLITISLLLGIVLVLAIARVQPSASDGSSILTVGRVTEITRLLHAARTRAEVEAVLTTAQHRGIHVERGALSDLVQSARDDTRPRLLGLAERLLESRPGIELIKGWQSPVAPPSQIIVKLDDSQAIVFDLTTDANLWSSLIAFAVVLVIVLTVSISLVSTYIRRAVIEPLTGIVNAASTFGYSSRFFRLMARRAEMATGSASDCR